MRPYFKTLSIRKLNDQDNEFACQLRHECLSQEHMDKIRRMIENYFVGRISRISPSFPDVVESWFTMIQSQYDFDPLGAFLILNLCGLERITLLDTTETSGFILLLLQLIGEKQHPSHQNLLGALSELRDITVESTRGYFAGISLKEVSNMIEIPSLRSFRAVGVRGSLDDVTFENEFNLEHLSLKRCSLFSSSLKQLLINLKRLRTLEVITRFTTLDTVNEYTKARFPRFIESISHLQGCLENLSINDYEANIRGSELVLSLLKPFYKLRSFTLEADQLLLIPNDQQISLENFMFYDFSLLPASLEELNLHGGNQQVVLNHLEYNIRNLTSTNLKLVSVDPLNELVYPELERAPKLVQIYKEHGIVLEFTFHPWLGEFV